MLMRRVLAWVLVAMAMALSACGGGGGDSGSCLLCNGGGGGGGGTGTASVTVSLSNSVVTATAPATVTAVVSDGTHAVSGVVVTFSAGTLGSLSSTTALTDTSGVAKVTLSPASSSSSGADTVTATATVGTTAASGTAGYALQAAVASFNSFTSDVGAGTLNAYGQAVLTISMANVSAASPVTLDLTSACASKVRSDGTTYASFSPAEVTTVNGTVSINYTDKGCGSQFSSDTITASIKGSSSQSQIALAVASPAATNVTFVSATPTTIFLKGSGNVESSTVKFLVVDSNNNPLSGKSVTMNLTTYAGGLLLDQTTNPVTKVTDQNGNVTATVNSGTVPTPVRVSANLAGSGASTVSSLLSVGIGLPSQAEFTLAQGTINIEGYDVAGTKNTYTVFAADRSGNPVPDGTAITFWAEGGQVATSALTSTVGGISSATANFISQAPVPADGRVTVVAYAIGEESFADLNGDNIWEPGEPFQDLGDIVKSRLFDEYPYAATDEYVSLSGIAAGTLACTDHSAGLGFLQSDLVTIPVRDNSCDGTWTPRTYVRRATETVLSTSSSRLIWADTSGIDDTCISKVSLQPGSDPGKTLRYPYANGETWYTNATLSGSLVFVLADENPVRLNPVAAGTTVIATGQTTGLTAKVVGGSPVASTSNATGLAVSYTLTAPATAGDLTVDIKSPGGLTTTYLIHLDTKAPQPCP